MSQFAGECGSCGVSANEYSCAHGAQIYSGDLTPYLTYEREAVLAAAQSINHFYFRWCAAATFFSPMRKCSLQTGNSLLGGGEIITRDQGIHPNLSSGAPRWRLGWGGGVCLSQEGWGGGGGVIFLPTEPPPPPPHP
jgi:hypothetical protein